MYPQSHFLFPLFIGELLVKSGYVDQRFVIIAVLVGVFVDLDHPIKHFFLTGELNPRKAWNAGIVCHEDDRTFIHHTNGILVVTILFIILSKYSPYWTAAVMLGYYSHMILDHFSPKKGFIDNMKPKLYWGFWKPVSINILGFELKLARHEIAFDTLMVLGLLLVTIF